MPACGWAYFTYPARLFDGYEIRYQIILGCTIDIFSISSVTNLIYRLSDMFPTTKKDLSTRIAENVKRNRASKAARNTAAFLALRGEINRALNDGWAILQIWETLYQEGKIRFGYAAFCRRVKRSMLSGKATIAALENKTADAKAVKTVKPSITGFTFESTPRKEDLL